MRKPAFIFDGRKLLDASLLSSIGFNVEQIGTSSVGHPSCILDDKVAFQQNGSDKNIAISSAQQPIFGKKLFDAIYH